jgi:hypothetical protein
MSSIPAASGTLPPALAIAPRIFSSHAFSSSTFSAPNGDMLRGYFGLFLCRAATAATLSEWGGKRPPSSLTGLPARRPDHHARLQIVSLLFYRREVKMH